MQRTSVLAALFAACASMAMVGCQARGGNPKLDANGDGILDPDEGSVRAPDVINQEAPSSPVATITGTLLDAYTGAPIVGATVKVLSAALTPARQAGAGGDALQGNEATSQAGGVFFIKNNAPGFQDVEITAPGYAKAKLKAEVKLPDAGGPTNNSVTNLFEIFMVQEATVGTIVEGRDQDANALPAGAEIAAQFATVFRRPMNGSLPNPAGALIPDGFVTAVGQVAADGTVTFNTPDFARCNGAFDASAAVFIIAGCGIDLNGDGIPDLTIATQSFTKDAMCKHGGKVPIFATNQRFTGAFFVNDTNLSGAISGTGPTDEFGQPFNANEPIVIRMNGQINLAGSFLNVINAFAHDANGSSSVVGGLRYDNSTPMPGNPGEVTPLAIDAFNYTAVLSLGPDGTTLLAAAPPGGWPLGQELLVRGIIAPEGTIVGAAAQQQVKVVNGAFATVSPTGPITIKRIIIRRNDNTSGAAAANGAYTRFSLVLDRVIKGGDNAGEIYVCTKNNMDGAAGSVDPYNGNADTLVAARCPTKALRIQDRGAFFANGSPVNPNGGTFFNDGFGRARLRARIGANTGLRPNFGNVIDVDVADLSPSTTNAFPDPTSVDVLAPPFTLNMNPFSPSDTISGSIFFNPIFDGRIETTNGVQTFIDNAMIPPGTVVDFVVDVQNLGGSSAPATRGGFPPNAAVNNFCFNIYSTTDTDFTAVDTALTPYTCP
ncbi:MAG: carboxypeptidase regulatory-like domain-containing protein [Deltaproteobacteria bacterium]|nr:carboxypeptidase regulatory-like domain-containing protein [Deltaproteobacteria bacterium]